MRYLFLMVFLISNIYAHGMNQPGPNNGYIKMIGTIHTELLLSDKEIKIYLLDIGFKNPTTENSFVTTTLMSQNKTQETLSCKPLGAYFSCPFKSNQKKIMKILLKVKRLNMEPKELVEYDLPLKY